MAPDASTPEKVPVTVQTATTAAAVPKTVLTLPVQVITQTDVSRLSREVEALNEFFTQAAIKGATTKTVPQSSQSLNALLTENKLNLLKKEDRDHLRQFLENLRAKAPVVNASFATDPKPDFLMKLVSWFRTEAHPHVLLRIGLQPNIAAGCIIRTTNKYFDFSFREQFSKSKEKLAAALQQKAAP